MNNIFFLIPFLLIAGIGIYQDVSALETIIGYDYFDYDNGDGTRTFQTHHPYIFDGNNWVPFVNSGLQTQTAFDTVILNADGSYTWVEKKITDKIIAKYADVSDLNSWTYLNTLNNDVPDNLWNGTAFVSTKHKAGIGDLDYIYSLNGINWKTQLETTNLSVLTTKAFGFDEIIDIESDTIRFGGVTRNLDNFDGVTFDKEFLDANKGKVIDLLNGATFDFDKGYENLYSVTVYDTGVNKSRLVFDYRTSNVLLPGETLVIDPTFAYTAGTVKSVSYLGAAGNTSCVDGSPTTDTNASIDRGRSPVVATCRVTSFQWDTSSIPDGSTIDNVNFRIDIDSVITPVNCDIKYMSQKPSDITGATLWTEILDGDTEYVSNDNFCVTTGNQKTFDLGTTADADLQALLSADWFAVGMRYVDMTRDATNRVSNFSDAELEVTYTLATSPPDSITDPTADTVGTSTASLSFTPPNLNGETLINYMLNVTTPQQSTPPSTFWMNGSASPFAVTGLTFGTDYSASASAYTLGGGNWTLANVLNFTTSSTTYSTPPVLTAFGPSSALTQIDLEFPSTMQNINGFRIQRETPISTGWVTIVSNTTSATAFYNNTGLSSNIIYNYRVYALNNTGISTVSNTYAMTTFHLPYAVTDLTGVATDLSTIDLSWTAPTSFAPEIEGYMINGTTPTGEPVDILNADTGTDATTATALNLLIGQEYSFRVSPITVHGMNATGNIWNGSTIQTFVIGNLSNPDITNDDDFSIFFERTDLNASAVQLDVTYPNSYNLSCDFDYKYARTNQTYSGLTTVPDGTDDQTATFTLINATGDLVQVRCWDPATGDESTYVITITDFPFLQQVEALRNGDYGTYFQIGAFDGVMLIVVFLGMIGLNRTTPIVGIIFVVITTFALDWFGFITYPEIMYPAMIMMVVWGIITTVKHD